MDVFLFTLTAAGYVAYHHHQHQHHQQRSREGGGEGRGQDIKIVQHSSSTSATANTSTRHENKSNMEEPSAAIIHGNKNNNNNNSTDHQQPQQQIMRSTQTARQLAKKWLTSFRGTDPRWKLAQFFCDELCQNKEQEHEEHNVTADKKGTNSNNNAKDGNGDAANQSSEKSQTNHADNDSRHRGRILLQETSSILTTTTTSSVFTVWRPTSAVSIRLMMAGKATGKGLEIKGKSSKTGHLSGFVPFLQIHEEPHKTAVGTIAKSGRVRVFFSTRKERDALLVLVERVRDEMLLAVEQAKGVILQSVKKRLSMKHTTNSNSSGGDNEHDPSSYRVGVHKAIAKFKKSTIAMSSSSSSSPRASSPMTVKGFGIVSQQDNDEREMALHRLLLWDMTDPSIEAIHDYANDSSSSSSGSQKQTCCFGIDMPNRLLWQALVVDADISRPYGTKHYTGRPSQPAFQDLNWMAINKTRSCGENNENENNEERRVVLWYICSNNSDKDNDNDDNHNNNSNNNNGDLDPRNLVMAYEEHGRVLPVVSDFDCFTMGTRGIDYKNSSLPADQVVLIQWCLDRMEGVLDKQQQQKDNSSTNWTSQWLEVLKTSAVQGFHPVMPKFGFGDVQSYHIMERAVAGLQETGAVRHGAECFNYYFPQELDAEFLIVFDEAPPPPQGGTSTSSKKKRKAAAWQYVNVQQLQSFLLQKIDQGFTFPFNPKWILCDGDGWKNVYNRLLSSHRPDVQDSLNVWFPPDSGIRQRIESISARYPNGFVVSPKAKQDKDGIIKEEEDEVCGTEAMDLATLELDRYLTLKRAKAKIQAAVKFGHLATMLRQEHPSSPTLTVA